MKISHLVCLASVLFTASAVAAETTVNYPAEDPIFSITFPDGWEVTGEDDAVSACSKDELANMELIVLEAEALGDAIDIAKEALAEEMEGIVFKGKPEKGELNGLNAAFLNAEVEIEEVKVAINCCVFAPKDAEEFFMLFNVIPFEALEDHGEDIGKILNSVKGK